MDDFTNLNTEELLDYLNGFIQSMEDNNWEATPDTKLFIDLHKKIAVALSQHRVYKVSNIDADDEGDFDGVKEYNIKYFASLKAAKRELHNRYRKHHKDPFIAAPDEIRDIGISCGICPQLEQSILSNQNLYTQAPGRFKFFEIRYMQDNHIKPIQYILNTVNVRPAVNPNRTISEPDKSVVIDFTDIVRWNKPKD